MKMTLTALVALSAATASIMLTSDADAQVLDLSGPYQCVQNCLVGPSGAPAPAYVTQNGWDLNLVNEAGDASRAWIDWPGHIWAQNWNEGAVYSADGTVIQFDRGIVWQRVVELPPPAWPYRVHRRAVRAR